MQSSKLGTLLLGFWPFNLEFYEASDPAHRRDVNGTADSTWTPKVSLAVEESNAQWAAYRAAGGRPATVRVDDATREHLRALGYMK